MVGKAKDWFPGVKATHEWLNSMKKSSRSTYQSHWRHFVKFTGMTGDQILADRKADTDFKWEKKTIEFKRWLIETKKKDVRVGMKVRLVARLVDERPTYALVPV